MASFRAAFAALALVVSATGAQADLVISNAPTQGIFCDSTGCSDYGSNGGVFNVRDLKRMLREQHELTVYAYSGESLRVEAPLGIANGKLTLSGVYVILKAPMTVQGRAALDIELITSSQLIFLPKGKIDFPDMGSSLTIASQSFQLVNSLAALAEGVKLHPEIRYALANDYDAGPDGLYTQAPIPDPLSNKFNGLGHVVSNLHIVQSGSDAPVGLFSRTAPNGIVQGLGLLDADISSDGASCAGLLVGDHGGMMDHVFATGSIATTGALWTGGLVGCQTGYMEHGWTSATVTGNRAGGLIGRLLSGTIYNSYAVGAVHTIDGPKPPVGGGLVGEVKGYIDIRGAYSAGAVSGPGRLGGAMGVKIGESFTSTGLYWNTTTSGQDAGCGVGTCEATGLTMDEFQSGVPSGLYYYWVERARINRGMPYLFFNPPR